jgi:S-adenosylmethionine:tRNA ribosyltransferase-isomerase
MRIEELRYPLDSSNIACEPPEVRLGRRDLGRMMVVNRRARRTHDSHVLALSQWLRPGDVFVLNNSKRMPGVLKGHTVSQDAQVEFRLAGLEDEATGIARVSPSHFIRVGAKIRLEDGNVLHVLAVDIPPHGLCRLRAERGSLRSSLQRVGLPITSFFSKGYWKLENYNNFYASEVGSIESPMAGMHLTPELIARLDATGIVITQITLHSVGSWLPFLEENIEDHEMLPERYTVPADAAECINTAKRLGHRVVACGSTVMRTIETVADTSGRITPGSGETRLYLTPGSPFRAIDTYFTNFHTYRSSLMVLDAAFCERRLLMRAYRRARQLGYLFHEFGDAVLYV